MNEQINVSKKSEPVMFTIRIDKTVVDFYDKLAVKLNRSRNELIAMALEYSMDKFNIIDNTAKDETEGGSEK